jgi:hypothetical protein
METLGNIIGGIMITIMVGLPLWTIYDGLMLYFKTNKKDYYAELKAQGYTDEEIAESFILPSNLTKEEKAAADKELSEFIKKKREQMTLEDMLLCEKYHAEHGAK